MSWLFSRALVEEYSEGASLAGEPSAQSSVMLTVHPFLRRGKMTDVSTLSRFGQTYALLTEENGKELLTLFLADSRARTSHRPAKVLAYKASVAASGQRWRGSFARYDPSTHGWRTAQHSLLEDSTLFSQTWPRSVSMRKGMCFQRARRASHTAASDTGFSLPTPSGVNGGKNHTMGRVDEWGGSSNPLRGTVIGSMCLPEFEELVMGWPIGWTAPTPYVTARFREWLREHGENSTPDLSIEEAA